MCYKSFLTIVAERFNSQSISGLRPLCFGSRIAEDVLYGTREPIRKHPAEARSHQDKFWMSKRVIL